MIIEILYLFHVTLSYQFGISFAKKKLLTSLMLQNNILPAAISRFRFKM